MKRFNVTCSGRSTVILAASACLAAEIAARRWITRSKYMHVNGYSVTHEGIGWYQAYVAGNSTGDPLKVQEAR